jgi:hypothetical protein
MYPCTAKYNPYSRKKMAQPGEERKKKTEVDISGSKEKKKG